MPEERLDDTIAAIATPIGEGGVSVIRMSGSQAFRIAEKIFQSAKNGKPASFPSHTLHFGKILNEQNEILDQVVLGVFREPHSYTAEDVVEISAHGGMRVTQQILDLIIRSGARHAEPGEFTKRSFLNGKIDLMQAEAVLDLIKAKSEKSVQVALQQLTGALSQRLKGIKEELLLILAHMEACLDFPDENLETHTHPEISKKIESVRQEIEKMVTGFARAQVLREGVIVAIVGKPNVGKSSLFNALLERERALVSDYPGTTRDHLEEVIEIQGVSVRLLDTAGLTGELNHPLDSLSMDNTRRALTEAHLVIFLIDGSNLLDDTDASIFNEVKQKSVITVVNKCDLKMKITSEHLSRITGGNEFLQLSTKTREGLELLERKIGEKIQAGSFELEGQQITRLRHKNTLESAHENLNHAQQTLDEQRSLEFVVLDVRTAVEKLRELIGEVYSEDLLDVIFAEFCIGK